MSHNKNMSAFWSVLSPCCHRPKRFWTLSLSSKGAKSKVTQGAALCDLEYRKLSPKGA